MFSFYFDFIHGFFVVKRFNKMNVFILNAPLDYWVTDIEITLFLWHQPFRSIKKKKKDKPVTVIQYFTSLQCTYSFWTCNLGHSSISWPINSHFPIWYVHPQIISENDTEIYGT